MTSLMLAVFRLNGRFIAEGDRLVSTLGLTSARWQVIGALALADTPQTVADIARAMGLTRQSVQRITTDLVEATLLERTVNPRHARADLLSLTSRGLDAYHAATRRQVPWANELAHGIAPRELEAAARVLTELTHRLQYRKPSAKPRRADANDDRPADRRARPPDARRRRKTGR